MIEVSLYMHPDLNRSFNGRYSGMRSNIANSVLRVLQKHIDAKPQLSIVVMIPVYFQIRAENVLDTPMWFVGAVGLIKVLDNYYMAYLVGDDTPLVEGDARDYLTMEKKSQEVYSRYFVPEPGLMYRLAYETPTAQLSQVISLTY